MSGIVPFNFGMDHQAWIKFYDNADMPGLCSDDPRNWLSETVDRVNAKAKKENELVNGLMKLVTIPMPKGRGF